jgi:hypothetical protein
MIHIGERKYKKERYKIKIKYKSYVNIVKRNENTLIKRVKFKTIKKYINL